MVVEETVFTEMELLQCFPVPHRHRDTLMEKILSASISSRDENEIRQVMCRLHLQKPARP